QATEDVGRTAGPEWNDHAHRPRRIALRGRRGTAGGQHESGASKSQEPTTRHGGHPLQCRRAKAITPARAKLSAPSIMKARTVRSTTDGVKFARSDEMQRDDT